MAMIDQRAVWAAEQAVVARKATIAAQWSALRTRVHDGLTQPTTIGAMALVGGIIGWRSAAPGKTVEVKCECPEHPPHPSILGGGMRALAIATLQAVAAIASEEFLRSIPAQKHEEAGTEGSRKPL
jgi:hypothetical protein